MLKTIFTLKNLAKSFTLISPKEKKINTRMYSYGKMIWSVPWKMV
jgi:hypothetical protein